MRIKKIPQRMKMILKIFKIMKIMRMNKKKIIMTK